MTPSHLTRCSLFAAALLALGPIAAQAEDDAKPKPLCKMSDSGVHLSAEGWSGPNCITTDAAGEPVASSLAADKARIAKAQKDGAKPADKQKPICKMGDPGVTTTIKGWEGPNCITADSFGHPVK